MFPVFFSLCYFTQVSHHAPKKTMTFDADLVRILDRVGMPDNFKAWLNHIGCRSPEDLGVLAPKEEHIKALILDESAKDGPHKVENANMTVVRLPVVKAWLAARRFIERCGKADKNENEGIPTGTERAIQTKWRARHNFELIGDMLLTKSNQKEMYKSITQSPRQVPVILAESMRPSTAFADWDLVQHLQ